MSQSNEPGAAVISREVVGDINESGEFEVEQVIVVSDMVPCGRVLQYPADLTGGTAETLVHPDTKAKLEDDGLWGEVSRQC